MKLKVMGIGIDLVMNSKIQRALQQSYAQRFIKKFLHQYQLQHYLTLQDQQQQIRFVASRWAIKQAVAKAIGRKQLIFNQSQIVQEQRGRLRFEVQGDQNTFLFHQMQIAKCHVSLMHEKEYTIGSAIIEQYIH